MDQYIITSELFALLAVFWLPVFALAAFVHWHLLNANRKHAAWLFGGLIMEMVIAFAIWVSPLHQYFLGLNFLGGFSIGSLPLQAAILASLLVTSFIWVVSRHGDRLAP